MQKYLQTNLVCEDHNQPLNLACLDENCEKRGIICSYCQYKDHKHTVRSLGLLFAEVNQDLVTFDSCLALLSQLDNTYGEIQAVVEKIQNQNEKKVLREMVTNYFQYHVQKLQNRKFLVEKLKSCKKKTVELVNDFIKNYDFVDKSNNPLGYSNSEFQVRAKQQEFADALKQLTEGIKNNETIDKILKIFEIDTNKKVRYFFNTQKSHKDFIITDKVKVQLKQGYSYRVGLLDPPARKEGAKLQKKTCFFKILKVTALVGVGLVYKKKVETANYLFSAYSQHGCYFITHSGYTYNQSNSTYNSQIKNWSFTTNDVIKVTLDPKEKKILFEKQGKDIFQFPFDDKPDMDINFAVLLCQQNESVEVVYG